MSNQRWKIFRPVLLGEDGIDGRPMGTLERLLGDDEGLPFSEVIALIGIGAFALIVGSIVCCRYKARQPECNTSRKCQDRRVPSGSSEINDDQPSFEWRQHSSQSLSSRPAQSTPSRSQTSFASNGSPRGHAPASAESTANVVENRSPASTSAIPATASAVGDSSPVSKKPTSATAPVFEDSSPVSKSTTPANASAVGDSSPVSKRPTTATAGVVEDSSPVSKDSTSATSRSCDIKVLRKILQRPGSKKDKRGTKQRPTNLKSTQRVSQPAPASSRQTAKTTTTFTSPYEAKQESPSVSHTAPSPSMKATEGTTKAAAQPETKREANSARQRTAQFKSFPTKFPSGRTHTRQQNTQRGSEQGTPRKSHSFGSGSAPQLHALDGLPPSATMALQQIHLEMLEKIDAPDAKRKAVFRDLQRKWHPDKNAEKDKVLVTAIFQHLNANCQWFVTGCQSKFEK